MRLMHNAVWTLVAMASLGVALCSTPALAQVWQASTDFSTVQGYRNWRYLTYLPGTDGAPGTYELMVFGLNSYGFDSWHTVPNNGDVIGVDWMHPAGPGGPEPARIWESPLAGTVRLTGTVAENNGEPRNPAFPADGVRATIWKNGELLFSADVADSDFVGYGYDLSVHVMPGDWLIFRVDALSTPYYDSTHFNPTITVQSLDSSAPGSWIEAVLRDESSYVAGLPLPLFEGSTTSARASRRLALSHGLTVAANLVAKGNIAAAMSELWAVSVRLDGDPSPPDWMLDGPEKEALYADIQQLIYLLGLL